MNSLTAFNPQSPYAHAIFNMTVVSWVILAVIFAVVGGLISYAMARFRWREGHAAEKPASSTSATSRTSTTGLLPATFRACNLCSRVALNLFDMPSNSGVRRPCRNTQQWKNSAMTWTAAARSSQSNSGRDLTISGEPKAAW